MIFGQNCIHELDLHIHDIQGFRQVLSDIVRVMFQTKNNIISNLKNRKEKLTSGDEIISNCSSSSLFKSRDNDDRFIIYLNFQNIIILFRS
jgi:hypothetical protein